MARTQKRKRKGSYGASYKKRAKSVPAAKRGYLRTGGYYGRYSGTRPPGAALMRQEKKFHDFSFIAYNPEQDGSINVFNSANEIAQDTTESGRIGRKVTLTSFSMRGSITMLTVAQPDSNVSGLWRFVLVLDKQANGQTATWTDVFKDEEIETFRNLANVGRFNILWDKMYSLNPFGAGAGNGDSVQKHMPFSVFKKMNVPVEYSGVNGTVNEIKSNNLVMLSIRLAAGSAAVRHLQATIRVRYTDS